MKEIKLSDVIVGMLAYHHVSYKILRAKLYGHPLPRYLRDESTSPHTTNPDTIRVTLSRLEKRGLVKKSGNMWSVTKTGLLRLAKIKRQRSQKKLSELPKHMIIAFDIPETKRNKRLWLRNELISMGFVMLQKSLWFGPTPIPKDFVTALGELHILEHIKFFKAQEYDIV